LKFFTVAVQNFPFDLKQGQNHLVDQIIFGIEAIKIAVAGVSDPGDPQQAEFLKGFVAGFMVQTGLARHLAAGDGGGILGKQQTEHLDLGFLRQQTLQCVPIARMSPPSLGNFVPIIIAPLRLSSGNNILIENHRDVC